MSKNASKSKVHEEIKLEEEIKEVSDESIPSSNDNNRYFKKRTRDQFEEDKQGINTLIDSEPTQEKK